MKNLYLLLLCFFIVNLAFGQTFYYSTGTNANPHLTTSWRLNRNNTGANPSNFTDNNQVFVVQNGHTLTSNTAFTISGTGSRLQVEGGGVWISNVNNAMSIRLEGTAGNFAIWRQTVPYASTNTDAGGNAFSLVEVSTVNFRAGLTYTGTVSLTSGTPISPTFNNVNLDIRGNLIIGANVTAQGTVASNRTHRVDGSVIVRAGGALQLTNGAGICTWNIGGSLVALGMGATITQGSGTGISTFNLGALAGTDSIGLNNSSPGINANINCNSGEITTLVSNSTINSGTINTNSGINTIFEFGTSVLSGTAAFTVPGDLVTLFTFNENGFRNAAVTSGCLRTTGTLSINSLTNYVVRGVAPTELGLATLSPVNNLTVNTSNSSVQLEGNLVVNGVFTVSPSTNFNISNRTLELNSNVIVNGTLTSNNNTSLNIGGSGTFAGAGLNTLGTFLNFSLNRAATFSSSANLTVAGSYTLGTGATHRFVGGSLSLEGDLNIAGNLKGGTSGNLTIAGTGTVTGNLNLDSVNNLRLNRSGATFINGANTIIFGTYNNDAGTTHRINNISLSFYGNATNAGTISANGTHSLHFLGTGTQAGFASLNNSINNLTWARTGTLLLGNISTFNGAFVQSAGVIDFGTSNFLTFRGDIILTGGTQRHSNSRISMQVDNIGDTIIGGFTLNNHTLGGLQIITGPNCFVKFNHNIIAEGSVNFSDGNLDIRGYSLTLSSSTIISATFGKIVGDSLTDITLRTNPINSNGVFMEIWLTDLVCRNLTLNHRSSKTNIRGSLKVFGTINVFSSNTIDFNNSNIEFRGDIILNGIVDNAANSRFRILGSGPITNFKTTGNVRSLFYNRPLSIFILDRSLTVQESFEVNGGTINLNNGATLAIGGNASTTGGTFIVDPSASLSFFGSGTIAGFNNIASINNFELSRATTINQLNSITINGSYTLGATATHGIQGVTLTLLGPATIAGTLLNNANTNLAIEGTGTITGNFNIPTMRALVLNRPNYTFTQSVPTTVTLNYFLGSNSSHSFRGSSLTLNTSGTTTINGTLITDALSNFTLSGANNYAGIFSIDSINNLTISKQVTLAQANNLEVFGNYTLSNSSTHNVSGDEIRLRGNIDISNGTFIADTATSLHIEGSGTVAGIFNLSQLRNFTLNRSGLTYTQTAPLTITRSYFLGTNTIHNFSGRALNLQTADASTINGTLISDSLSDFSLSRSGAVSGSFNFNRIRNINISKPISLTQVGNLIVAGNYTLVAGATHNLNNCALSLRGDINLNGNLVADTASGFLMGSSGTFNGTLPQFTRVRTFEIHRSGISYTQTGPLRVTRRYQLAAGATHNFSGQVLEINTAAGNTLNLQGFLISDSLSSLLLTGAASSVQGSINTSLLNNFSFSPQSSLTLGTNLRVRGAFTLGANSTLDISARSLTLQGAVNLNGNFASNSTANIFIIGSGIVSGALRGVNAINAITFSRPDTLVLNNDVTCSGTFTVDNNGIIDLRNRTINFNWSLNYSAGSFLGNSNTNFIINNASGTSFGGTLRLNEVNNLQCFRTGSSTIGLESNLIVQGQLRVSSGNLFQVNSNTLTINNDVNNNFGEIRFSPGSSVVINGTGNFTNWFPNFANISNFAFNRRNINFVFQGSSFVVTGSYNQAPNTTIDISGKNTRLSGGINMGGVLITNSVTVLTINNAGTFSGAFNNNNGIIGSLFLQRAINFVQTSNVIVNTSYQLVSEATHNFRNTNLDFPTRNITVNGSFIANANSNLTIRGEGGFNGSLRLDTINNFNASRLFSTVNMGSNLTVLGTFTLINTQLNINSFHLNLLGPIDMRTNLPSNTNSSLTIGGSSFGNINLRIGSLKTLRITRNTDRITLINDITVQDSLFIGNNAFLDGEHRRVILNGVAINNGTFSLTNFGSLEVRGTGTFSNNMLNFSAIRDLILIRPLNYVHPSNLTVTNTYELGTGVSHDISNRRVVLQGNLNLQGTLISNNQTQLSIENTGTINGALNCNALKSFSLNRNATLVQGTDLNIDSAYVLASNAVHNTSGKRLTFNGNAQLNGSLLTDALSSLTFRGLGRTTGSLKAGTLKSLYIQRVDTINQSVDVNISDTLYLNTNAVYNVENTTATFQGRVDSDGYIKTNQNSNVNIIGSSSFWTYLGPEIRNFYINRAQFIDVYSPLIIHGTYTNLSSNGTHSQFDDIEFRGPIVSNGVFSLTSNVRVGITGSGSLTGRLFRLNSVNVGAIYINRENFVDSIVSTNSRLSITDSLHLVRGILKTGPRVIRLQNASTLVETGITGYVIGNVQATRTVGVNANNFGNMGFSLEAGAEDLGSVTVTRKTGTREFSVINADTTANIMFTVSITGNQPTSGRLVNLAWLPLWEGRNNFNGNVANVFMRNDQFSPWLQIGNLVSANMQNGRRTTQVSTTHFSDFVVDGDGVLLPVSLLYFKGTVKNSEARLNWRTANELNNKGFYIERSFDGKNFESIDFVKGYGTTQVQQNYAFQTPLFEPAYFRLNQTDYDGKQTYSPTIYLANDESDNIIMEAYPNPNMGQLSFKLNAKATWNLYDLNGKLLMQQEILPNAKVSLLHLESGVYLSELQIGNDLKRQKINLIR